MNLAWISNQNGIFPSASPKPSHSSVPRNKDPSCVRHTTTLCFHHKRNFSICLCVFSPSHFRKTAGSFKLLTEDMYLKWLFSGLVFFFLRWKTISSADNSGLRVSFIAVTKQCQWPHTLTLPCRLGSLAREMGGCISHPPEQGHADVKGYPPLDWEQKYPAFIFHNYNKEGPN